VVTAEWLLAAALLISGETCILWGMVLFMDATEELNARLPEDKRFNFWDLRRGSYFDIRREYRRVCPQGHLVTKSTRLYICGFALILSAAIVATTVGN
jgi:hypothetical protein